jgi:hypothetical protein
VPAGSASSQRVAQLGAKEKIMKKTRAVHKATGEMRPEYEFDYKKAQPNRFAANLQQDAVADVLDPDVAQVLIPPSR